MRKKPPTLILLPCEEYFAQASRPEGGAEDDEVDVLTRHGAAVALEDTFSGLGVAERWVVVIWGQD